MEKTTVNIAAFFDESTYTVSYLVADPQTRLCAVIDPVLDYDPASGRTATAGADRIVAHVTDRRLEVAWIAETHVHADHLTAAPYLADRLGGKTVIGAGVGQVQQVFGTLFNAGPDFDADGSQFDRLVDDEEIIALGSLEMRAMSTPGHTPACMTYVVGDAAFVGDTLFMPDYGTARTDFPGGDAATLYRSIRRILALPAATRLFTCHDYTAPGRDEFRWESTVGEQRAANVHIHDGVSEEDFVRFRTARDAELAMPALILPSVQVNMRAGRFPPPESNGQRYLKIPLDAL